ncbi:MAG: NTP transferase domain-containing protein [Betaproteobacteria bacterium]
MGRTGNDGGGCAPRRRIGAVLLAAGEGQRLGGVAKPAIAIQGVPLVKRALIALSGAGVDEVVVVLGHAAQQVEPLVQDFPVALVRNERYRDGQMSSVHAGLAALSGPLDAVLVCLADQPLLEAQDIAALIGAFEQRAGGSVMVPYFQGRRGNPAIFDGAARAAIVAAGASVGCRRWIDEHPQLVTRFEAPNDHYVVDLDTAEDLTALRARLGLAVELPAAPIA